MYRILMCAAAGAIAAIFAMPASAQSLKDEGDSRIRAAAWLSNSIEGFETALKQIAPTAPASRSD